MPLPAPGLGAAAPCRRRRALGGLRSFSSRPRSRRLRRRRREGRRLSPRRRCTTAGLVVWLNTAGEGTAQGTIHDLNFTNLSGHACRIFGFPGVSAVGLAGHGIGRPAKRDAPHPGVVLANGATATASLLIVNVSKYPASICRPVLAAGLRVYPPNRTASRIVPFPFRACRRSAPVFMLIQAVTT